MFQRLIYVSDAVGTAGLSILSIAQIIGVSQAHNRRDRISGVLITHKGQFLQLIEGAHADVQRLMKRLRADPRHTNIRVIADRETEDRCFGSAPMACVEVVGEVAELIADRALDQLTLDDLREIYRTDMIRDLAA